MAIKQMLFNLQEESDDHDYFVLHDLQADKLNQNWFILTHCPLCGSKDDCLINSAGTEIICKHTLSTQRVGFHSWLHHLSKQNRN
ncbi:hypothetical protein ABVC46_01590 [Lactobacillus crispatus]|jgi:hypothetical protein|uniref:Uncharacterized protein n=1 Tax=Lactobacillus crispatus TaxID=47770 RepID=A0AAW8WPY5_9LACO|nr:hypothetical protein [Lactobacillus crispatus]STX18430.1 Uncharacterised protein [Lactobacillus acidophilus]MCT7696911.1 hypothetical protein [Lactobacillus crispatus]MCT7708368.1 hypothetical protein [Lactobacillus crispatus]MCT7730787.1 hypothetical protein [Lactobacillus crispatus]MCT7802151.1 hypothetical protein [Lactobacillus crispatus]